MLADNATELFAQMEAAIRSCRYERCSSNPTSPCKDLVMEAPLFMQFTLRNSHLNLVNAKSVDLRWATANALHFFADTEEAEPLLRYNERAKMYLTSTQWIGAYGAIAMPQVRDCIRMLRADLYSRRAFISMGSALPQDINRPACWNNLHFLYNGKLEMHCYQRSLNLHGVMPYDLIVLTNLHRYMAEKLGIERGWFYWTIGSLHCLPNATAMPVPVKRASHLLPFALMDNPGYCRRFLEHPERFPEFSSLTEWLCSKEAIRT